MKKVDLSNSHSTIHERDFQAQYFDTESNSNNLIQAPNNCYHVGLSIFVLRPSGAFGCWMPPMTLVTLDYSGVKCVSFHSTKTTLR